MPLKRIQTKSITMKITIKNYKNSLLLSILFIATALISVPSSLNFKGDIASEVNASSSYDYSICESYHDSGNASGLYSALKSLQTQNSHSLESFGQHIKQHTLPNKIRYTTTIQT